MLQEPEANSKELQHSLAIWQLRLAGGLACFNTVLCHAPSGEVNLEKGNKNKENSSWDVSGVCLVFMT